MKVRTHFHLAKLSLNHISNKLPEDFSKKFFYLGTIIADCCLLPFSNPHFLNSSYNFIEDKMKKLSKKKTFTYYNSLELGIIIHYLCDFCCHSHITGGIGNPNKHMLYERQIQRYLLRNLDSFGENFNVCTFYRDESTFNTSKIRKLTKFICYHLDTYTKGKPSFEWDIVNSIIISSKVCETFFDILSPSTEISKDKNTCISIQEQTLYSINDNEGFRIS